MAGSRRDRCELLIDLLRAARNGARKTQMFRSANTNHSRGSEYLGDCVEAGLIREVEGRYHLTDRGQDLLEKWDHVERMLPGVGPSEAATPSVPEAA